MSKTPINEVNVPLKKRKIVRDILKKHGVDCSGVDELDELVILLDQLDYVRKTINASEVFKKVVKSEV